MKRARKLVEGAQALSDVDLRRFLLESDGQLPANCQIELAHAGQLSNEHRESIVQLFESNMKTFYEQSSSGYQPDGKRQELFADQARYLLIFSSLSQDLLACAHFRFDIDYGMRVLYLYELQVKHNNQGQGLGRWSIEHLKTLARLTHMSKIVLTVHKNNQKAIDFYLKKCHFTSDITDPSDEDVDYIILSRTV